MQTIAERQLELLRGLLDNPVFREWVWNFIGELHPFHELGPDAPERLAWRVGRQGVGLGLLGAITSNFPLRYASMLNETSAWRAQRESRVKTEETAR